MRALARVTRIIVVGGGIVGLTTASLEIAGHLAGLLPDVLP